MRAGRHGRVPVGGHAGPLHRAGGADGPHLPGPAAGRGIISPCDPCIVAARIKRADRRPQGWDLNLSLVRDDLDRAAVAVLEHQFPGPGADSQSGGVQPPHLVATGSEAVDNWPDGVEQLHPAREGSPAAGAGGGGGLVGEFFAALGRDWRLTGAQRARLAPAVATALTSGWTPQRLAP
jgi:hypothetical protein